MPPQEPNYSIRILEHVHSKKFIQKKNPFVEDIFFQMACGLFYEGNLNYGKLHGNGILLLKCINLSESDQIETEKYTLYKGEFEDNFVSGKGQLNFANNIIFEVSFNKGIAHGFGKLMDSKGNVLKEGVWVDGNFSG